MSNTDDDAEHEDGCPVAFIDALFRAATITLCLEIARHDQHERARAAHLAWVADIECGDDEVDGRGELLGRAEG